MERAVDRENLRCKLGLEENIFENITNNSYQNIIKKYRSKLNSKNNLILALEKLKKQSEENNLDFDYLKDIFRYKVLKMCQSLYTFCDAINRAGIIDEDEKFNIRELIGLLYN